MTWLVTGGAGYIGAHVVRALVQDGASVVVLDDLSTGDASRVDPAAAFVEGSVLDRGLVRKALREHGVTGVVHIAAKKQVGESMADPLLYYRENVEGMVALLEGCQSKGVDKVVFSSSAATYGLPDVELVDEDTPGVPLSPYGESKLIGEWVLRHCERAVRHARDVAALLQRRRSRLARARGHRGLQPHPDGLRAPAGRGAPARVRRRLPDAGRHLHPRLRPRRRHRRRPPRRGQALEDGAPGATYNIGRGEGSSVLDVLRVVGEVTGLDATPGRRRPPAGRPGRVVAKVDRIREGLGFTAQHDLRSMVESAWAGWQVRHP
jgi:UDP-glucose 4-epimerase